MSACSHERVEIKLETSGRPVWRSNLEIEPGKDREKSSEQWTGALTYRCLDCGNGARYTGSQVPKFLIKHLNRLPIWDEVEHKSPLCPTLDPVPAPASEETEKEPEKFDWQVDRLKDSREQIGRAVMELEHMFALEADPDFPELGPPTDARLARRLIRELREAEALVERTTADLAGWRKPPPEVTHGREDPFDGECVHPPAKRRFYAARDDTVKSGQILWGGCTACGEILVTKELPQMKPAPRWTRVAEIQERKEKSGNAAV